jgi:heme exporter protein C
LNFYKFSSPRIFYPLAATIFKYMLPVSILFLTLGLYTGFFIAPTDFQQGEAYRIIFINVPAAWMSMIIYVAMAFWNIVGMSLKSKLSFMMSRALAPTGAIFTFIALVTGAFWGKPMWGAWWVWDARLTSELILLFLYIGYITLVLSFDDTRRGERVGGIYSIVSVINVPIIYFSVVWWNTLHQGASVSISKSPSMAMVMLIGMLLMLIAFWTYSIAVVMLRLRRIILESQDNGFGD